VQHFIDQPDQGDHGISQFKAMTGLFFDLAHGPLQMTPKEGIIVLPWHESAVGVHCHEA